MKRFEINWNKKFPFIHITKESLYLICMQFMVIGILGWIMESILEYIFCGHFADRGFLCGPFIPIYAFFILLISIINVFPKKNIKSMIICFVILSLLITIAEELVGQICEKILDSRLWTYDNIVLTSSSGYTNFFISILWGILSTLYLVYVVPLINKIALKFNSRMRITISVLFLSILIIDLIVTINIVIKNGNYQEIFQRHKVSLAFSALIVGTILYFILVPYYLKRVSNVIININNKLDFVCFLISFFLITMPIFSIFEYLEKTNIKIVEVFATIGFINVAFLIYLLLAIIIYQIIKLFIKNKELKNDKIFKLWILIFECVLSILVCLIGVVSVKNPKTINLNYGSGENKLNIVAVSDLHYKTTGSIINLDSFVKDVNKNNPDVLFLLGDIVDTNYDHITTTEFSEALNKIDTKYGIYLIPGNHEYESNKYESLKVSKFFRKVEQEVNNFHFLCNDEIVIDHKIRVIGRLDYSYNIKVAARVCLADIEKKSGISDEDKKLPLIVLDHQPNDFMDSYNFGAKLQLSGHTHDGQLFPFNVLLKIYNLIKYDCITYGNYSKDDFNLFVTRGYGHWGFPLRTSGRSELLQINFSY